MHRALFRQLFIGVVLAVAVVRPAVAGYTVGLDFIDAPAYFALSGPGPGSDSIHPWPLVSATTFDGAVAGTTAADVERRITYAVQELFRDAAINRPGEMLNVRIAPSPVAAAAGANLFLGSNGTTPVSSVYGLAEVDAANTRPDLDPELSFHYTNNYFSAVYLDAIESLPVTFSTVEQVTNAVAGTAAHEIAHTLGFGDHDPAVQVNGRYSVMSSGVEGLPAAARLTERGFFDIPPESGGPSVVSLLLQNAGTTQVTDFNFDLTTDSADGAIYLQHAGTAGVSVAPSAAPSVAQGDVTNDGLVNVLDRRLYALNAQTTPADAPAVDAEIIFDPGTGELTLVNRAAAFNALVLPDLRDAQLLQLTGGDGSAWLAYQDPSGAYFESQRFDADGNLAAGTFALGHLLSGLQLMDHALALLPEGSFARLDVTVVPEPLALPALAAIGFGLRRGRRLEH